MSFTRRIKYFLVHQQKLSNKEADRAISNGEILLNGRQILTNEFLDDLSEIVMNGKLIREAKKNIYLKFYKPVGYESSLNVNVKDNLSEFFKEFDGLAIAGRLDKASEGLLLLSNDGKWIENLTNPKFEKEKEYVVELDKHPDERFIREFSSGIDIGGYVTQPCSAKIIDRNNILVILKEGKNRQIRKMCKILNYNVLRLKRVRIHTFNLDEDKPGSIHLTNI